MMHAQHALTTKQQLARCTHCDEPAVAGITSSLDPSKVFCCAGCKTVYEVLNDIGLDEYYNIKERAGSIRRRAPVQLSDQKYLFLDHDSFHEEYAYKKNKSIAWLASG